MMGQLRERRSGWGKTIYFKHGDERLVRQIEMDIAGRELLNAKGNPFESFSDFAREAINEKAAEGRKERGQ